MKKKKLHPLSKFVILNAVKESFYSKNTGSFTAFRMTKSNN
jgi:hypothetical protein